MDRFIDAFKILLDHEGGFVNHKNDRGGATKYGITIVTLSSYQGRPATIDDIKALTIKDAERIYWVMYWEPMGGPEINDFNLAFILFDQAVNRGVSKVIRQVQKCINLMQSSCQLAEDGIMGESTLKALNAQDSKILAENFLQVSRESYRKIVEQNPSQQVFLAGWMNRVDKLAAILNETKEGQS